MSAKHRRLGVCVIAAGLALSGCEAKKEQPKPMADIAADTRVLEQAQGAANAVIRATGRDIAEVRFRAEIAEFTLEANPCGAGAGFLRGWRSAGVTRLSVGVQSFDDGVLRALGRPYSAAEALRFCRAAREAGFEALAVDLMTGIPGEMSESVASTVRTLLELEPDHVSAYFLENVEGLPFEATLARHPVDEDAAVEGFHPCAWTRERSIGRPSPPSRGTNRPSRSPTGPERPS